MNLNTSYNWLKFKNKNLLKLAIVLSILFWIILGLGFKSVIDSCNGEIYTTILGVRIQEEIDIEKKNENELMKLKYPESMCLDGRNAVSGFPFSYSEVNIGVYFKFYNLIFNFIVYFVFFYIVFLLIDKISFQRKRMVE
ncbi:MAG: hypothetical protein Q7K65_04920 [Candidatus Buchananbacteria bacterium]|nr:hypothetical protein [Candidatus Buchananbacteria bacterium]